MFAIAASLAGGCAAPAPPQPSYEIGVMAPVTHLDPLRDDGPGARTVSRLVFRTLPQIARRIDRGDRHAWTFALPPDERFSDGVPLDASAVVANVRRWTDVGVASARALDAKTVVIAVRDGRDLAARLRDPRYGLVSPLAIADTARLDRAPVGSGPYEIRAFDADSTIELIAVPADARGPHAGTSPRYASVFIRYVTDPQTAVLSLEKDDLDVVYGFPETLLDQARAHTMNPVRDGSGLWCAFATGAVARDRVCPPGQA